MIAESGHRYLESRHWPYPFPTAAWGVVRRWELGVISRWELGVIRSWELLAAGSCRDLSGTGSCKELGAVGICQELGAGSSQELEVLRRWELSGAGSWDLSGAGSCKELGSQHRARRRQPTTATLGNIYPWSLRRKVSLHRGYERKILVEIRRFSHVSLRLRVDSVLNSTCSGSEAEMKSGRVIYNIELRTITEIYRSSSRIPETRRFDPSTN
jgi:hypothetical protein